jgi:hypothetical protein
LSNKEMDHYNEDYSTYLLRDMSFMARLSNMFTVQPADYTTYSTIRNEAIEPTRYGRLDPWTIQITNLSGDTFNEIIAVEGNRRSFNVNEFLPGVDVTVDIPRAVGGYMTYYYLVPPRLGRPMDPYEASETRTLRVTTLGGPRERMDGANMVATTGFVQAASIDPNATMQDTYTYTTTGPTYFTGTGSTTFVGGQGAVGTTATIMQPPAITPEYHEEQGDEAIVRDVSDLKQALRDHLRLETRMELVGTELCLKVELSFDDEIIAEIDDAVDLSEVLDNLEQE